MKTFTYKVLPLVLALALGGCGGGGEGSTPTTGSTSNAGGASLAPPAGSDVPAGNTPLAATDAKTTVVDVVDAVDKYVGVWTSCYLVTSQILLPSPPGIPPQPLTITSSEKTPLPIPA
jgi:hypothetical protein